VLAAIVVDIVMFYRKQNKRLQQNNKLHQTLHRKVNDTFNNH